MRAKDLHMAATVDLVRRVVMVTGAIDQNDQNLVMHLKLPEPGVWTFIKAETNLSQESWLAWRITLGGAFELPQNNLQRLAQCGQFKTARYLDDRGSIIFNDGEVRPGECILKIFNVSVNPTKRSADGTLAGGSASHARMTGASDSEAVTRAIAENFGEKTPNVEIDVPVRILS